MKKQTKDTFNKMKGRRCLVKPSKKISKEHGNPLYVRYGGVL